MTSLRGAAAAALLAVALPLHGAPHEINVFTDEMEARGEVGVEMHVNTARGRSTPDYPGEIPPHRVWRVMPEIVLGLGNNWETGLHLPMQFDRDGTLHADGLRLRFKHLFTQQKDSPFFSGVNVEWGYDQPHLSEDRHNLELRGIIGWKNERWMVAANPILAWVVKGQNRSRRPDFEGSLKVARHLREGLAIGIEHYAGMGRVGDFAARRDQDHMLYFAVDYERRGWSINFGVGRGLTKASDDVVIKTIIGIPF